MREVLTALREQALAQVVAHGGDRNVGTVGELGDLEQLLGRRVHPRNLASVGSCAGPAIGARTEQLHDLLGAEAGLVQHLLGVLAERRGRGVDCPRGAGELHRDAQLPHRPQVRLLPLDDHLALADELGVERLVDVEHRLDHRVVLVVEGLPLGAGPRAEDLRDLRPRLRAVAVELLGDQVLALDAGAEARPELRLERAHRDVAVGGLVGQIADEAPGEHAVAPPRHLAVAQVGAGDHRQPGEGAVGHRDVDQLALARSPRLVQRGHDPERRHHRAAAEVGDLPGRLDRPAVLLTGQAEQPDQPEIVHVVPRPLHVRPGLPVAGDRAVDQRRVLLPHPLVADPEPVEDPGAKPLEHDVEVANQAQERIAPAVGLQVEADRALVAVQRQVDAPSGCREPAAPRRRSTVATSARSPPFRCPRP